VSVSLVRPRRNPITGAIVTADVVLKNPRKSDRRIAELEGEIIAMCRQSLAPHKVPALVRIVPALDMTAIGKLAREAR
jgi:acyl-coenzyme A synthetase/AMP-(fatty) acid ligase